MAEPREALDYPLNELKERLRDLNTKAYYLLVALCFLYRTNVAGSLKAAMVLTALTAVLPLQDILKSKRELEFVRWGKVSLLFVALVFTIWWVLSAPLSKESTSETLSVPSAHQKPSAAHR